MPRPGPTKEKTIGLFLLGLILFNPPFLNIFNADKQASIFDIPLLYIYLFVAWIVLIFLVAVTAAKPSASVSLDPPIPQKERHKGDIT